MFCLICVYSEPKLTCCPGVGKNRRNIQADSEAARPPTTTEARASITGPNWWASCWSRLLNDRKVLEDIKQQSLQLVTVNYSPAITLLLFLVLQHVANFLTYKLHLSCTSNVLLVNQTPHTLLLEANYAAGSLL